MQKRGNGQAEMVVANGTIVLQFATSANADSHALAAQCERAVDDTSVLRRAGAAVVRESSNMVELSCQVEYGPCLASRARGSLRRQSQALQATLGANKVSVFDREQRELTPELLADLHARVHDLTLPLDTRTQLQRSLRRVQ